MPHPVVISPNVDHYAVEGARWIIEQERADGATVEAAAALAAEYLADTVAMYGGVSAEFDPTDAELFQSLNAPGFSEENQRVRRLVADIAAGVL